jgi:hypothetical protein
MTENGADPTAADQAVEHALELLQDRLELTELCANETHTALDISGLDDEAVVDALGLYLVALLAGIVQTNLTLSTLLLGVGGDGREELRAEVEARLAPSPDATNDAIAVFDQNVRDPWIAEGLGHAVLAIRGRVPTLCVAGDVKAMAVPHAKPSQQGLDLFAIYADRGYPAMALGEAKATRDNGSARLGEASVFFQSVAKGKRDVDIRMQVVVLAPALSDELRAGLSYGFWHERACYLPLIAHGDVLDLTRNRRTLREIARPVADKRVLNFHPADYDSFFANVAGAMRRAVDTIYP